MRTIFILTTIIFAWLIGCKKPYSPSVISSNRSMLVVEGNLNAGADSTTLRLTRTFKLDDTARLIAENNAQLTIEGRDNSVRSLSGSGNGYYTSSNLNLIIGKEYRLRIITSGGNEYLSDYVKARITPDIDSVGWDRDITGAHVYVNTGDPSGNTVYYRWNYDETWEIRSYYYSRFVYENGGVRPRLLPAEDVSVCWKNDQSRQIILANSKSLTQDIIYKKPIVTIPSGSEKFQVRYSILLRQYSLDKNAYDFFEIMKKNTEEIGSIFSPQPSEIRGNIHNVNDLSEAVIGYVTVSEEKQKRVFITRPTQWDFSLSCTSIDVPKMADSINYYFGGYQYVPYDEGPTVYLGTEPYCADCTIRGGVTTKPSFW
ncbi:MAG: DUF4249 domain-containing protein [Chitinophagaceae bacterium]|nr:DUF4249 domain-containing protein [Chitinophagaceae bacterium]MCB9054689.1 DUF4249 domain-containing protein [Chitinophagales bacterium]